MKPKTTNLKGMNFMKYKVNLIRDDEASVWIAVSDDIPGLVLESDSLDKLVYKVRLAAPELLELNSNVTAPVSLYFVTGILESVAV